MELGNPGIHHHSSPYFPRSASHTYFTDRPFRSGSTGLESGKAQFEQYDHHQHHSFYPRSHPFPPHHSPEFQDAIRRELENERIRGEIIMSEIVSRRAVEAEIRRQVMRDRELALRRANDDCLHLGSTSFVRNPTRVDDCSMEKRIMPREMLSSQHDCNAWMVLRQFNGQRISEVVKPRENVSGLKRNDESLWYAPLTKKVKTKWTY